MPGRSGYKIHLQRDKKATFLPLATRRKERVIESNRVTKRENELRTVKNQPVALYTLDNKVIQKLVNNVDILEDLKTNDDEIDMELTGNILKAKYKILIDDHHDFVYNYDEYEVIKKPDGDVDRITKLDEKPKPNVNDEEEPVKLLKRMSKLAALQKYAFRGSLHIIHTDGLTYDFVYDLAKDLHERNEMALVAPVKKMVVDGKEKLVAQRLRLRAGSKRYWGLLEGRVDGEKYALILHLTSLELT